MPSRGWGISGGRTCVVSRGWGISGGRSCVYPRLPCTTGLIDKSILVIVETLAEILINYHCIYTGGSRLFVLQQVKITTYINIYKYLYDNHKII